VKVLADTSVWIELFRRTGSPTAQAMRRRLDADEVAITDIVIMEILAGETHPDRLAKARRAVDGCAYLGQRGQRDAIAAAALYRRCRRAGETPRQLTDCLIAAVAIRNDVPVLHRDRDYDAIARHFPLRVVTQ
jgi:predicted nucleic acid-binding protein